MSYEFMSNELMGNIFLFRVQCLMYRVQSFWILDFEFLITTDAITVNLTLIYVVEEAILVIISIYSCVLKARYPINP